MTRTEKVETIELLKEQFANSEFFYITDASTLSVAEVNRLRGLCHKNGIIYKVAKNTLIKKALEANGEEGRYDNLMDVLKGPTSIMFSEVSNAPAKVIKEFRKKSDRPVLKAAYIDTDIFIGDENLNKLSELKSKEELVGEIISLLQSPAKNVISALQSGGNKLSGIIKTLSDKEA